MNLMDVSTFRDRIGEVNISDINILLESAMSLVTSPIETLLNTRFLNGSYSDVYFPEIINPVVTEQPYGLVLSSGFIDSSVGVKVYVVNVFDDLESASETEVEFIVDYAKGFVQFPMGRPGDYIRVDYTSGLPEIDEDETWDSDNVPIWLQDITVAYAQAVYQHLVWIRSMDEKKQSKLNRPVGDLLLRAPAAISSLAAKHIRWYPTGVTPAYTVTV